MERKLNTIGEKIIGVDEAGRGAFAGPLCVAAVVLNQSDEQNICMSKLKIRDSKTLSERQRELVYALLIDQHIYMDTVIVPTKEINEHGIGWANTYGIRHIAQRMMMQTKNRGKVIVDGYFPQRSIAVEGIDIRCLVNADATELPVILAGIVAKVTRDKIMKQIHNEYPKYGWNKNKGYGTVSHREAIQTFGIVKYHRLQFVETSLGRNINKPITQ